MMMEKHKCKLCFRSFSNGRALGGHMRSHMVNLAVHPKPEEPSLAQLSFEAESASSSSSSEGEDDKGLCYGLRENPKRSFRLVDPEFSFAVETGSVILQDRESETESSKNPTRRRSKRACNQYDHHHQKDQVHEQEVFKKLKSANKQSNKHNHNINNNEKSESCWVEPEPVSTISDATTEEDVAFCLMMLSRDKWKRKEELRGNHDEEDEEEEDEEEEEEEEEDDDEGERSLEDSDESEELKSSKTRSVRGRYKCETCKKVFRSYQALGGHRASHKKIKVPIYEPELERENAPMAEKKIHECPVCFRVFASGQALGGHKRTHVSHVTASGSGSATPVQTSCTKFGDNNLIDLNLPAPVEDDDVSQIENSAVSDAEFLKPNAQLMMIQR